MAGQLLREIERCAERTVCLQFYLIGQPLILLANMDDFISRWKTLDFSKEEVMNTL